MIQLSHSLEELKSAPCPFVISNGLHRMRLIAQYSFQCLSGTSFVESKSTIVRQAPHVKLC